MKIRTGIEKLGKGMILLIFSIFTIFPFVWMILSALKTKAEIMDQCHLVKTLSRCIPIRQR